MKAVFTMKLLPGTKECSVELDLEPYLGLSEAALESQLAHFTMNAAAGLARSFDLQVKAQHRQAMEKGGVS